MATGKLTIDLDALARNWRALDALSGPTVETGATVKANGYGLGVGTVARTLAHAGARRFFVAVAEEGAAVRQALGPGPEILVYGGHMAGDTDMIADLELVPILNSVEQVTRHAEALPGHPFGVQLDTGMNRLGMEPGEWSAVGPLVARLKPMLLISHLACADERDHAMNAAQLATFREMTDGFEAPRSLAATGGILLGPDYHFDLTRPGIGIYGALPFEAALPVVRLALPVIQTRDVGPGESVGYGQSWVADAVTRVATVSAGYADGISRALSNRAMLFSAGVPCPVVGRVSMDLVTADITHLDETPDALELICPEQSVDDIAELADTIGYEVLTAIGRRYIRRHLGTGT